MKNITNIYITLRHKLHYKYGSCSLVPQTNILLYQFLQKLKKTNVPWSKLSPPIESHNISIRGNPLSFSQHSSSIGPISILFIL